MSKIIKLKDDIFIANDLYDTREIKIGKFFNKDLYRKTIVLTSGFQSPGNWKDYSFWTLGLPEMEYGYIKSCYVQSASIYGTYVDAFDETSSRTQLNIRDNRLSTYLDSTFSTTIEKIIICVEYTKK